MSNTSEGIKTNADKIRSMNDEDLFETLYKLQGQAAACPDCFKRTGKMRLKIWLSLQVKEDEA